MAEQATKNQNVRRSLPDIDKKNPHGMHYSKDRTPPANTGAYKYQRDYKAPARAAAQHGRPPVDDTPKPKKNTKKTKTHQTANRQYQNSTRTRKN